MGKSQKQSKVKSKSINPEEVLSEKQKEEIRKYLKERMKIKLLIYSHAPFIRSSQGILSNYLSMGFVYYGFPTIICAHYGIEPGGFLRFNQIPVMPVEKTIKYPLGEETTRIHFSKFNINALLYCHDFWKAEKLSEKIENIHAYARIDSINYTEETLNILKKFKGVISPTKFAEKELNQYGIKNTYIPLGFNIRNYFPQKKIESREYFKIPTKDFCIGIVGKNEDTEPRKGWDSDFESIRLFFKENPGAKKITKIFIHTDPFNKDGINLQDEAKKRGIKENIIWQDPHVVMLGIPEPIMAKMYSSIDVLLNLSHREGSNLTVLEAGACGVPSIVTDFSVMRERVNYGKCGWLVKPLDYRFTRIFAKTAIPDPSKGADALTEAYTDRQKLRKLGKKASEYAKQNSWQVILEKYWVPYLEKLGNVAKSNDSIANKE